MIDLKAGAILTQTVINNITETGTKVTNIQNDVTGLNDEIDREFHHDSWVFPENSNETYIMSAGAVSNVFGAWAEMVNNVSAKLSDKCRSGYHLHISGVVLEDASVKDKIYIYEIAYGDGKTVVSRGRFMSGNTKAGAVNPVKVRAEHIPFGELIYARLKCETANATLQGHIRYHLDPIGE